MKEDHFEIPKTILFGSLKELVINRDLAYVSQTSPQHSHLTPLGEQYVMELVRSVLPLLVTATAKANKENAENIMMDKLSK